MSFQFPTKTWQKFTRRQIARLEQIEAAVPDIEFVQSLPDRRALLFRTTQQQVSDARESMDPINAMLNLGARLESAGLSDSGQLALYWEMPLKNLRPDYASAA